MPAMAALLEENQRLRAQWKSCEYRRQCAEQRAEELQSCVQQAEAAVRQKEAQWMAEFDRSVQALLQIIQHHEDEKTQLQKEVARLRAEAATATVAPAPITKMTRCTQTEKPRRNSVRFAKEEDEEVSEKERPAIDAEALHRLSRMQVGEVEVLAARC
jgi:phosphoribosylanthranilate isomerase